MVKTNEKKEIGITLVALVVTIVCLSSNVKLEQLEDGNFAIK